MVRIASNAKNRDIGAGTADMAAPQDATDVEVEDDEEDDDEADRQDGRGQDPGAEVVA